MAIECSIENFVPVVGSVDAIYRRIEEYDVSSSTPKARGDPKHVDEEKPLYDELPSVLADAERFFLWRQITRIKKKASVSNQEETTMCSLIFPKMPIMQSVRRQTTRDRCVMQPKKRVDGIAFSTKIRRLDHGRSSNTESGKRVEMRTQKRSNRAR